MFNALFLQGTRKQCAAPYLFWWRHSAALSSIVRNINVDEFNGQEASGDWTLVVRDMANLDKGVINTWSLDITQ